MGMQLQPYQQRVMQEKKELDEKRQGLLAFLRTQTYNDLGLAERDRLTIQSNIMGLYSEILRQRIVAFIPSGTEDCDCT